MIQQLASKKLTPSNGLSKKNYWLENEIIVPFRCPYCNNISFAVKNFEFRLLKFIDNFTVNPKTHHCSFIWQNLYNSPALKDVFMTNENEVFMPKERDLPQMLELKATSGVALSFKKLDQQNWRFLQDNGDFFDIKIYKDISLKPGVLLTLPKLKQSSLNSSLKIGTLKSEQLGSLNFIKDSVIERITLPAAEIVLASDDYKKLNRQIYIFIQEFKKIGQQPLLVLPKDVEHKDKVLIYRRSITFLASQAGDELFRDILIPEWLDVSIYPQELYFKTTISF